MATEFPIFAYPNYVDSTFTGTGYNGVQLSGGSYESTRPRTRVQSKFLNRRARTTDAVRENTYLNADLGTVRDARVLAIPEGHNISVTGRGRGRLLSTIAWSNVTVDGVNALNATTLNVAATGNVTIRKGEGFTIAGDTQVYQPTADLGLGENPCLYSEDLSNATWTKSNSSTGNQTKAPDYQNDAYEVVEDGSNTLHSIYQDITSVSNTTFSCTVYAKRSKGSRNLEIRLIDNGASSNYIKALYDFDGETVANQTANGNGAITTAAIEEVIDDYYLCTLTGTVNSSAVTSLRVEFALSQDTNHAAAYIGNSTSSIYIWGIQVNTGTTALAYAKTTSAAAQAMGSLSIERVDDTGTGLAAATTGSEVITCHAGDIIDLDSVAYDTGLIDVWQLFYEFGTLPWGHPSFFTGKPTSEDIADGLESPFYGVSTSDVVGRYARFDIVDEDNTDSYIALPRVFVARGWEPTKGIEYGISLGRFIHTSVTESKGGAKIYEREGNGGIILNFGIKNLPQDEGFSRMLELYRKAGIDKQIFFILSKDGNVLRHESSFLCTMEQLNPARIPYNNRMNGLFKLEQVIA